VLSEQEIQAFKAQIMNAAGDDGKLSNSEANAYLKSLGVNGKADNLYGFLNGVNASSENIVSSSEDKQNNAQTTDYTDGTTATVDKDGNIVTTYPDGRKVTTDRNGNKTAEEQTVQNSQGENYTQRTEYDSSGNKEYEINSADAGTQTITYNTEGKEIAMDIVENETSTHEFYDYDENGEPVLKTRIENEGTPKEASTGYTYGENGQIAQTTTTTKNGETFITDYEYSTVTNDLEDTGQVCTQTTNKGSADETVRIETTFSDTRTVQTSSAGGTTTENYVTLTNNGESYEVLKNQTTTTSDGKTINITNSDEGITTTVSIPGENGCTVVTRADEQGNNVSQTYTANGKTTTVQYTGDGNTYTYMQSQESVDDVCNRFGVTKEELFAANPDKKVSDYGPGAHIIIPGEVPATDMVGRKDYEGVVKDVNHNNAELARQNKINRLEQEVYLDPKTYTESGKTVTMTTPLKRVQKENQWGGGSVTETEIEYGDRQQYQVVGKTKGGECYIVKDKNNELHYANKELTHIDLRTPENMGKAMAFKTGKKELVTFDHENNFGAKKEIVYTGETDRYGNKLGVTDQGFEVIVDKKTGRASYVGSKYADKLTYKSHLENDTSALAEQVTMQIGSELDFAQQQLDIYKDHETGSEKAADFISGIWGSENRESVVRQDIAEARAQLASLEKYKNNPKLYAEKFKQTFGVKEYNPEYITEYFTAETPEAKEKARVKAFGNGKISNMMGRVDGYIDSQVAGGQVIETGFTTVVSVASGGAGLAVGTAFEADRLAHGRYGSDDSQYSASIIKNGEWNVSEWADENINADNAAKFALNAGAGYALKKTGVFENVSSLTRVSETHSNALVQSVRTAAKNTSVATVKNAGKQAVSYVGMNTANAVQESVIEEGFKNVVPSTAADISGLQNTAINKGESVILGKAANKIGSFGAKVLKHFT